MLSKLIIELTDLWINWMKADGIARSTKYDLTKRLESVDACENLMNRKIQIINEINDEFSRIIAKYRK